MSDGEFPIVFDDTFENRLRIVIGAIGEPADVGNRAQSLMRELDERFLSRVGAERRRAYPFLESENGRSSIFTDIADRVDIPFGENEEHETFACPLQAFIGR